MHYMYCTGHFSNWKPQKIPYSAKSWYRETLQEKSCLVLKQEFFCSCQVFCSGTWADVTSLVQTALQSACPSKTPHYFVDETLYSLKSVGGIGDGMWARSFLGFSPSLSLFSLHPAVGEPNTSLEPTLGFSYPSPLTWSIILSLFYVSCWFLLRVFSSERTTF